MSTQTEAESAKIRELREKYEAQGFEVLVEPDLHDLPFDLGGYRPDLLARRGDAGILVEVRTSGTRLSVDRFRELVDEVKRPPGWSFVLVTADDVAGGDAPGVDDALPPWRRLRDQAAAALRLAEAGESREAAFLALWAALEGVLRKHAEGASLPVERLPSSVLVRALYSHGELALAQYELALALLQVRNRVVHGYASPALDDSVRRLTSLVRELLRESMGKAA